MPPSKSTPQIETWRDEISASSPPASASNPTPKPAKPTPAQDSAAKKLWTALLRRVSTITSKPKQFYQPPQPRTHMYCYNPPPRELATAELIAANLGEKEVVSMTGELRSDDGYLNADEDDSHSEMERVHRRRAKRYARLLAKAERKKEERWKEAHSARFGTQG